MCRLVQLNLACLLIVLCTHQVWAQDKHAAEKTRETYLNYYQKIEVLRRIVLDKKIADELLIVKSQQSAIERIYTEWVNEISIVKIDWMEKYKEIVFDQTLTEEEKQLLIKKWSLDKESKWIPIAKKAVDSIESELLPHQLKRVNQLIAQIGVGKMQNKRYESLSLMLDQLEVDKEDQDEVKLKLKEIQAEYDKRFAELQKKYQHKFVKKLSEDTRTKLSGLIGELDR
jgi:hypothetical protein